MNGSKKGEVILRGLQLEDREGVGCFVALLDQMECGILIIDRQEQVLYINDKYTEITGVSYDEIVHKNLRNIRPGAQVGDAMKSGNKILNLPRAEGATRYFVDLAPIVIDGRIVGGMTVMKNFEDAEKMFDQLRYFKDKAEDFERAIIGHLSARFRFDDIVGSSPGIQEAVRLARRVAPSDAGVLLSGKTGTGKELFAQSIHNHSRRHGGPFVPINCGAIPENLIESELFGYVRGAFTGAEKSGKLGLFELASHGTLFLDEIENMGPDLQIKLLRVLQESRIRKIGALDFTPVDVRVIAATNVDIEELIADGRFREDLYYRICVFHIPVPDLADRPGDVPLLVDHFLERYRAKYHRQTRVSADVYEAFSDYGWPGNVRELQNTVEYLLGIAEGDRITLADLPAKIRRGREAAQPRTLKEQLKVAEREILQRYLGEHGQTVEAKREIARSLGVSMATLYNKLSEHSLL